MAVRRVAAVVNNAAAAVAFAGRYLKDEGIDVYFVPEFEEPVGDGGERTVVLFEGCKAAGSAATGKSTAMQS